MPRAPRAKLPIIAVEDRSEKLALSLPGHLHQQIEAFSEYFVEASGQKPTSLNAVILGVIAGYIDSHRAFQQWRKARASGHGRAT